MEKLSLTFRPRWKGGSVAEMLVSAELSAVSCGEGLVLSYQRSTVAIPFAVYDGLTLSDSAGEVPFEMRDMGVEESFVERTGIYASRPVSGALCWSYTVYPRVLPEGYTSSPYFDWRAEEGGINGAGLAFLILPDEGEYDIVIGWDMRDMPEGARGIWSLGAGDTVRRTDMQTLRYSFYAVGGMNMEEWGEFGIYWFGELPFDIRAVSGRLRDLFAYMCRFFGDSDPTYCVFIRRDPFEKSGGGTALKRSFLTGYSAVTVPRMDDWYCVLAHEMVHNWPHMDDEPAGKGTWYNEGIAEYYSVVLPYRVHIVDAEETVRHINEKAGKYLNSPLRDLSNRELAKIYWSDRHAQAVPYGRGFVYLSNVEAQLKRASRGSIDDITKLYTTDGTVMQPKDWTSFIWERLGDKGLREFENMEAGKLVVPDLEGFGGTFLVSENETELNGRPAKTYEWSVKA
jgi:hypothetical protein